MTELKELLTYFGTPIGVSAVLAYALWKLFNFYRTDLKESQKDYQNVVSSNTMQSMKVKESLNGLSKNVRESTNVSKEVVTLFKKFNGCHDVRDGKLSKK